jgi:hypothetical protein
MFFVDEGPICEGGLRGFRTCAQGHVVVLCDECEAMWIGPAGSGPLFGAPHAVCCPECGSNLFDSPAHWSDTQEIAAAGWQDFVAGTWLRDSNTELPSQPAEEE